MPIRIADVHKPVVNIVQRLLVVTAALEEPVVGWIPGAVEKHAHLAGLFHCGNFEPVIQAGLRMEPGIVIFRIGPVRDVAAAYAEMGRTGEYGGRFPQFVLGKFPIKGKADIHAERDSPLVVVRCGVDRILHDEVILIVVRILYQTGAELFQVDEASGVLRSCPRFVERRQQQTGQNRNDCNNDEKFD